MPDLRALFAGLAAALLSAPAAGQHSAPDPNTARAVVIAIPPLATAKEVETEAGDTWTLANQIAELIAADLKSTNSFILADVKSVRIPSFPEVTAPSYAQWRSAGAKLLLSGFVNAGDDGRLRIGCYLYDVRSGRELSRQGFALDPGEWRRAAHLCADAAYTEFTGRPPRFDSRIAYVAQSGAADDKVKRLAVMDFDGANHAFLTESGPTVIAPVWSPGGETIAYTSFAGDRPTVRILEVASGADRPAVLSGGHSFAPAFAPGGDSLALSMSEAGNVDIYAVALFGGGMPRRLTISPAIDTSPSYSPDGRKIAFSSDRSGIPQLYVMDSDGSNQRRISFGAGEYGAPSWSPDGERIAFTNLQGTSRRIGVIAADGSGERLLTNGPSDEEPEWSPDGGQILFHRLDQRTGRTLLAAVPAAGGEVRIVQTPQGASDPAWAARQGQRRD